MLANQRALFDLPDDVAYLNCAYMSPLSLRVQEAGRAGIAAKGRPWTTSPPDFFSASERIRALFARFINAAADDIAIIPAASYGVATAALNLPLKAGQEVVLLDEEHSSNIYSWREAAKAAGGKVRAITRKEATDAGGGVDWTACVLEAIGDQTAVVALPNLHWTDGTMVDLVRVGEAARAHGAALVLDITQSGGAMAFDVDAVKPDYLVDATYKWLMGPYTMGFLYVAPQHQDGRPLEENWIDRMGSEDFSRLVEYRDEYQPGARRGDRGERANFQLMPMAEAGLEQLLEWGIEEITETLAAKTSQIAGLAAPLGFEAFPIGERAPHYLGLRAPDAIPDGLVDALRARNVFVSVRGDSIRVTPHVYNTDADVERFIDALKAVF